MNLAPLEGTIDPPANRPTAPEDDDAAKRRALLAKLRDDRKDLVRVAGVVRDLAETVEVAQSSLAIVRQSLRWLALAGGVAALTQSLRMRRRPTALLLTGLSLFLVQRWLSHPVRQGLSTSANPVVVHRMGPPPTAARGALSSHPASLS